jgi:uncharacterized protein (DUF697 family)
MNNKHQQTINAASLSAVAAAVPGSFIPASDLPILVGIWATMFVKIGHDSGHDVDYGFVLKLLTTGTAGAGAYWAGGKAFGYLLHLIPVVGTATYVAMNASLNALVTLRLGKLAAHLFDNPDKMIDQVLMEELQDLSFIFKEPASKEEMDEARKISNQRK